MQHGAHHFHALRGLLALWVLAGHLLIPEHYGTIYNLGFATHSDFGALGLLSTLHFLAVDIFFMLSGYSLTMRYDGHFTQATKGREIDRFYLRRLKRIWPLHMLMVGLVGAMALAGIAHPISSGLDDVIFKHWEWTLALNAALMNAWGIVPVASWNEPSWTLSITFLLYVLFPNLALMLARIPSRRGVNIALLLLMLIGYGALSHLLPLGSHSDGAGAILRGVVFFISGMLLTRIQYPVSRMLGTWVFFLAILAWVYLHRFPLTFIHLTYPFLLLGLANAQRPVLPATLSRRLGEISFPLFISHYPLLLLLNHYAGNALSNMAEQGGALKMAAYLLVVGYCLGGAEIVARLDARLHRKKTEA